MAHLRCTKHNRRVSFGSVRGAWLTFPLHFFVTHRSRLSTDQGQSNSCDSTSFTAGVVRIDEWELELLQDDWRAAAMNTSVSLIN